MLKFIFKISLKTLFLVVWSTCFAQELPPNIKYNPSIYNAGNQNWMIGQHKNGFVYFANNDGLLEFNGACWSLYKSPNETIIRSVKIVDERIYTGSYMEFGFWKKQSNGQLAYTSLSNKIKNKIQDDEQFWNIISFDQWIVFQSLSKLYVYDSKNNKFNIIAPKNEILKSYRTANAIYFQVNHEGLFEIENGKSKLISNNPVLQNNRIINVFGIDDGLLIQTQYSGIFKLVNEFLTEYKTSQAFDKENIYSSYLLSDGSLAIGTVSNGIYVLDKFGQTKYHITQKNGLCNNTVLSLFEDIDKNLWVGLDNGINCINLKSPVKSFLDDTGVLGTVYASILFNQKLYIGTNQGLFFKNYPSNDTFQLIEKTKGQVWSLFENQGTLFCGHDLGTFIITNQTATNIAPQSGTWKFTTIPNRNDIILQGNYLGISVLQKTPSGWAFKNKITGFNYSSRFFEIANNLDVYVGHEYKGVFKIKTDSKFLSCNKIEILPSPLKGKNAGLIRYNNDVYYACKDGVFKLNKVSQKFEKDKTLSVVSEKDSYTTGKMIVDQSNKIWLFSKNYIHYFTTSKLSTNLKQNTIPIPSSLTNSMLGYENIYQLSNSIYLIGTTDGYYTLNINDLGFKNYSVSITNISINHQNQIVENASITEKGIFNYDHNNINFTFTVSEYNKYINAEYKFLLDGFQDNWSEWSSNPTAKFENLSPGTYTFKVKAKIANSTPENIAVYTFTISKPWYGTWLAIILYILLFLLLARYIHKAYKKYYQKQREHLIEENNLLLEIQELENEKILMKLQNEKLVIDVDTKNKELAVSTMSLITKNELLNLIKDDLKNDENVKNVKSVISNINKNISGNDSWSVFKEAFDNADKDFLKKAKAAHKSLTPNDLRLCAYLRLNLSSKEIAPLLNISVRSVEIKRYRLRKKMELPHETGLVEYILSI
jgi:AraC family transcriptional regulator, chitin signaling transcriptional activator